MQLHSELNCNARRMLQVYQEHDASEQHAHLAEAAKLCDCNNPALLLKSWKLLTQLHSNASNAHSNAIDCSMTLLLSAKQQCKKTCHTVCHVHACTQSTDVLHSSVAAVAP
jgi:hypothetical protein